MLRGLTEAGHRRARRPHRRRAAVRRRGDLGGAVRGAGRRRRCGTSRTRSRTSRSGRSADLVVVVPATADLMARAAHGLRRRPADQHAAHRHLPGRVRARRCTPRCGSTRRPGPTSRRCAPAASVVVEPAVGRLTGPTPARAGCRSRPRSWPCCDGCSCAPRPAQLRRDLAGRRVVVSRRRHPRAARPGALPRQPLQRAAGLRARGGRGRARRRRRAGRRPTSRCPTRPASRWCASGPPSSSARPSGRRPPTPTSSSWPPPSPTSAPHAGSTRRSRRPRPTPSRSSSCATRTCCARWSTDPARPGQVVVGFAAETGDADADWLAHGRAKLAAKGCDLLVVNRVGDGLGFEVAAQRRRRPRRGRQRDRGAARAQGGPRRRRLGPGRRPPLTFGPVLCGAADAMARNGADRSRVTIASSPERS